MADHERILQRDEGESGVVPSMHTITSGRSPVFTPGSEFERRVDSANGSKVTTGLATDSEGGSQLMGHLSASSEVTPWEPQGLKASFGKVKKAVGKVFKNRQAKRP